MVNLTPVLVQDFVVVDAPPDAVVEELATRGAAHLRAASAEDDAMAINGSIELGPSRRRHRGWVIPVRWPAAEQSAVPGFDGDLVVADLGPTQSWLGLEGSFVPRAVGTDRSALDTAVRLDRLHLRELLEHTATSFASGSVV